MKKIFPSVIIILLVVSSFVILTNNNLQTAYEKNPQIFVDTIWISVVGDLMCHSPQIRDAMLGKNEYNFNHMFEFVKTHIESSDLAIGNLETVLGGTEKKFSGYPLFNSPDEFASALKNAGFDLLITSNNHCLDRGFYGLERTLNILDSLGLYHTGTFRTYEESEKIQLIEIRGIKLAIFAYTYGTNGINPPKNKNYCVAYIDTNKIKLDIQSAKTLKPDKIIVYLHWGNEYQRFPNNYQQKITNFLFENGVDIILGSHPHVIQPAKLRKVNHNGEEKNVFVIYSLGNFISNQRKKYTDSGVILKVSLIKNYTLNHTYIDTVITIPTYVSKINGRFRVIPIEETLRKIEEKDTVYYTLFQKEENKLRQILIDFENHIWSEF